MTLNRIDSGAATAAHRQNRHATLKAAISLTQSQHAEVTEDWKEQYTVDELVYGYKDRVGDMVNRGLKDKGDTQHEEMKELQLRKPGVTPTTTSNTKFRTHLGHNMDHCQWTASLRAKTKGGDGCFHALL